jgi:hypothetical protein
MDARPKSNKLKRLEKKRKLETRSERLGREDAARVAAAKIGRADRVMKESKSLRRDPERALKMLASGEQVCVPATSDLRVIAGLFAGVDRYWREGLPVRPDIGVLRRLVFLCREKTDMLSGRGAAEFANALLALSAHSSRWVRPFEEWEPRSHNAYRQFHALVRHLLALYDVPTFMNSAWLEGLTGPGIVHQRWFIDVAQGRNIRTSHDLPVPLSKKQAHIYLQAPDHFDVLGAFRRAQILDFGGDDRLVDSVLSTRIGTTFLNEEFWSSVFRWLVAHPMLDPAQHGPIIDYLYEQKFVASVPNPEAHLPGRPLRVAPQPNLTMKGRNPETLLRSVAEWHRRLGRVKAGAVVLWRQTGIALFSHEEGRGESRKVYTITELIGSDELIDEGRAMGHCVGSYAESCASGRVSIWSLQEGDTFGQRTRLLTLEVSNQSRQIIQARRRHNELPGPKEMAILGRWAVASGLSISKWLAR